MIPGKTYKITMRYGDCFIGEFLEAERGFLVFIVNTEVIPIRESSLEKEPELIEVDI